MTVGVLQPSPVSVVRPAVAPSTETAGHLVDRRPERIAGALEPEHQMENVDGDHRLVVRRIGRTHRREQAVDPCLVDALVGDLPGFALSPCRPASTRRRRPCRLTVPVVDLQTGEPGVHPESAGFVRDDRDDPVADVLIPGMSSLNVRTAAMVVATLLGARTPSSTPYRRRAVTGFPWCAARDAAARRATTIQQIADLGPRCPGGSTGAGRALMSLASRTGITAGVAGTS